jgi:hypothetical protein
MATIVLSAAGMALGGAIGGSVLGLSMATAGRAIGAMVGARIDQGLLGVGSAPVETGRIDRFRLTSAAEGSDIAQVFGRMRLAGQVIWASHFSETSTTTPATSGGKGTPASPQMTHFAYRASFAVALCEGPISRIGRIWADGVELAPDDLNMRVYLGDDDQLPDPKISAVEGADTVPAYRGTAYVVFEDLPLADFGNRVPQMTFEVVRADLPQTLAWDVQGVALIPGTGEYGLATQPIYLSPRYGDQIAANINTPSGKADCTVALDALQGDLPRCKSAVLVVSWFGNDLRCGHCHILPKVEQNDIDAAAMPWRVSGLTRASAPRVALQDGRPIYGGTPADAAVIEAIRDLHARGLMAVFYPFILMEQLAGNDLPDPWTGGIGQSALPWRGRITTARAAGLAGSSDGTTAASAEVAAFMGPAQLHHFSRNGDIISYTGPKAGGYRRFILHYAHLCAAAGGVSAFCIGSEMRGLTQIRGAQDSFPAVAALRVLAGEVRSILGPDCKISYAADWSEYHGYQPAGSGDKYFHLDPLWADPNIDFIGIDHYMPLADWRDGPDHADAAAGTIYDLAYLRGNIAGGEGYDWYYPTPEARAAQRRVPITDGDGEPWVWRYKDLRNWWSQPHHDRVGGQRAAQASPWVPQSKPFWFTEFGCAAIDKGANQPNKFLDAKSSESGLPYFSNGNRDDLMQMQYLRAMLSHYADPAHNPQSQVYGGSMIDLARMHVWAWDTRPYPFFPANHGLWDDAGNYARGHWLNGRATNLPLAAVVGQICQRAGVGPIDTSRLFGNLRGYLLAQAGSGRAALQPLQVAYGVEVVDRGGTLVFVNRDNRIDHVIGLEQLALDPEHDQPISLTRAPLVETAGRVQVVHLDADGDYDPISAEALDPTGPNVTLTKTDLPLALTRAEGRALAARWLAQARQARDSASFALPPSQIAVGPGDVVALDLPDHRGRYRIDRIEDAGLRRIEATRISATPETGLPEDNPAAVLKPFARPVPVELLVLDLPLLRGDELPHAPHVAVAGQPWPGSVAIYGAAQDSDYVLQDIISSPARMGQTTTPLPMARAGLWDRHIGLELRLISGAMGSASAAAVLAGANLIAIGDGTADKWEVLQYQTATALGGGHFALRGFLRGQAGSRGIMPAVWPAGSQVVVLDAAVDQLLIPSAARGLARYLRYGPAKRPLGDASFRARVDAIAGNGLRPYPVAHLRGQMRAAGLDLAWIRCSRIDGDLWADGEIPLGESNELYQITISRDGVIRRQISTQAPVWTYAAADIVADHGNAAFRVAVAQVSDRFGAGPARALVVAAR